MPSFFFIVCRFSHAASAFENCDSKYRAVFAEPKTNSRSSSNTSTERTNNVGGRFDDNVLPSFSTNNLNHSVTGGSGISIANMANNKRSMLNDYATFMNNVINPTNFNNTNSNNGMSSNHEYQLNIICSSTINQDQLWRLFDIVPSLEYCHITGDCGRNSNYATVSYCSMEAAQYAR